MSKFKQLREDILNVIKTNGVGEITGESLGNVFDYSIESMASNAAFAGAATPSTNPGQSVDATVFYVTNTPGMYIHFDDIEVKEGNLTFIHNMNGAWEVFEIPIESGGTEGIEGATFGGIINADPEPVFTNNEDQIFIPQTGGNIYGYMVSNQTLSVFKKNADEDNPAMIYSYDIPQKLGINVSAQRYQSVFGGIVTPTSEPKRYDRSDSWHDTVNIYYLANEPGTYINFNNYVVKEGQLVAFVYESDWKGKLLFENKSSFELEGETIGGFIETAPTEFSETENQVFIPTAPGTYFGYQMNEHEISMFEKKVGDIVRRKFHFNIARRLECDILYDNSFFRDIATPTTVPPYENVNTERTKVFYLASTPGIYINFNNYEVKEGQIVAFIYQNYRWIGKVLYDAPKSAIPAPFSAFGGHIYPDFQPTISPDYGMIVTYVTEIPGVYQYFDNIEVNEDVIAFISNRNGAWHIEEIKPRTAIEQLELDLQQGSWIFGGVLPLEGDPANDLFNKGANVVWFLTEPGIYELADNIEVEEGELAVAYHYSSSSSWIKFTLVKPTASTRTLSARSIEPYTSCVNTEFDIDRIKRSYINIGNNDVIAPGDSKTFNVPSSNGVVSSVLRLEGTANFKSISDNNVYEIHAYPINQMIENVPSFPAVNVSVGIVASANKLDDEETGINIVVTNHSNINIGGTPTKDNPIIDANIYIEWVS